MSRLGALRLASLIGVAGWASFGASQVPDLSFQLDLRPNYRTEVHGPTTFRWYDVRGRHSTVALQFILEPGLTMRIAQKLQRIPNDGDDSQLDEYYVEDRGSWRIGKQYLPFGRQLLRESVVAARSDTDLFLEAVPVSLAVFDGGVGKPRGGMARLGGKVGGSEFGLSVAFGHHLGIGGPSLTVVRLPEETPGKGRGYRTALGADYSQKLGPFFFVGEVVRLMDGDTPLDETQTVWDLSLTLEPSRYRRFTVGYSRVLEESLDFLRIEASIFVTQGLRVEPVVRYREGAIYDFSVGMNLRF